MKLLPLILISVVVIGIGLVVFFATRNPTVRADIRDVGKDMQRGVSDAYNDTKDAAEDVKDMAKDAVK